MSDSHHTLVVDQFGSRAKAYVESPVHSAGADLDFIEAAVQRLRPSNALDLGCGGGHVSYRVAPHVGSVTAYDLSTEMLDAVTQAAAAKGIGNIEVRQGSAERLPFADEAFDVVLCRYSAHHWIDFEGGLRESARVLKRGGTAVFSDGVSLGEGVLDTHLQAVELLRDPSHVRDRSLCEWSAAMVQCGLVPTVVRTDRIRMDFASWTGRMRTPDVAVEAIRYLQRRLDEGSQRYFGLEPDGSFQLDTAMIEAIKP